MSLGRLLAAGRSLIGAHDGAGRYRVNKHIALPKFISPRNPFTSAAKTEASSAVVEPPAKAGVKQAIVATAKGDAVAPGKSELRISVGVRAAHWLSEWGQKIKLLPRLAKKPAPVKSLAPRLVKAPIQPELSLDKVRVVRNDLSDADFEVVPAKTLVAVSPGAAALTSQQRFESTGNTWNRLTTRIFGAGQT